jgi:hypothetical protein
VGARGAIRGCASRGDAGQHAVEVGQDLPGGEAQDAVAGGLQAAVAGGVAVGGAGGVVEGAVDSDDEAEAVAGEVGDVDRR